MVAIINANPYYTEQAIDNSCYMRFDSQHSKKHLYAHTGQPVENKLAIHIHEQLRSLVMSPSFPCMMGRAVTLKDAYRFGFYKDGRDDSSIQGLCRDLYSFLSDQTIMKHEFASFIATFEFPKTKSERDFERFLWQVLQAVHEYDQDNFDWDPSYSSDPDSDHFSFSFGGKAFFVIGMHAFASRYSRVFPYATLIFNAHEQFHRLQDSNRFTPIQAVIRAADIELQGSINPSLANVEAKQYSGRKTEKKWSCPFAFLKSKFGAVNPHQKDS